MRLLVTGGTGYIGSHFVRHASALKYDTVVLDSLESGHKESIPSSVQLYEGNVDNKELLSKIFSENKIDAVVHFAGYIQAGESVVNPQKYFHNNLISATTLLQSMVEKDVNKIIFSSTAAVYGDPQSTPIPETHPTRPTNPYGLSKLFFEQTLDYWDRKFGLKFIALRYFNAAGASLDGKHGEAHQPESHIIPLAIDVAQKEGEFGLNGVDYETPDGTCVRDYIHIEDLASAHILAINSLVEGHHSDYFNVGTGKGYSNKEVLSTIESLSGKTIKVIEKERRAGDPPLLVADSNKIQTKLGWKPKHSSIEEIIKTALEWHTSHPQGYSS